MCSFERVAYSEDSASSYMGIQEFRSGQGLRHHYNEVSITLYKGEKVKMR